MVGIYKIENKITHKVYIGQSTNIAKRWTNHKSTAYNEFSHCYNYPLYCAIRKYGIENFSFQVVEECKIKELNDKEKYWIQYYNSTNKDNGYNLSGGGNESSHRRLNQNQIVEICDLLKETEITQRQIAIQFNVSEYTINKINSGELYVQDNMTYPIRPFHKKKYYCCDCGKEIVKGSVRCVECNNLYSRKTERPNREELKELIRTKSFLEIGRIYNVSDNSIRKWCKYECLPSKKSEIKQYTDEEWLKV